MLGIEESTDSNIRFYVMPLSDTNFYNEDLNIIRIKVGSNYHDIQLIVAPFDIPHPDRHVVLIFAESELQVLSGIDKYRLQLPPGIIDNNNTIATSPGIFGLILSKKQRISRTLPTNASSSFNIKNVNFAEYEKGRIAISPVTDRAYTNKEPIIGDKRSANIGLFINDNVIMIKSHGGQITLGDEGVHIGGKVSWSDSKHNKEIMADNMFHGWIPQTIPTAGISIPYMINISYFVNIGEAGQKFINVASNLSKVPSLIAG